jgi:dephospho-CoA kinase
MRPWIVGITGGIGSGKSAVTDRLAAKGIDIIDADLVAREVVAPGTPAHTEILDHFGSQAVNADGTLDRPALRLIVFSDPTQREILEAITHPRIRAAITQQLAEVRSPYAVLSSPLLLESGQQQFAHYVVVVDVPESLQQARTMARDQNSEELVKQIMAAQLPRAQRLAQADYVIDNSGDLAQLDARTDALHTHLLTLAAAQ